MSDAAPAGNHAPGFAAKPGYRVDLVRNPGRARVIFAGITLADSVEVLRVEETGHEPVLYFPRKDVRMDLLARTEHHTYCPFKGQCSYWTISGAGRVAENAVWGYEAPYDEVRGIKDHLAFYRSKVDQVTIEAA